MNISPLNSIINGAYKGFAKASEWSLKNTLYPLQKQLDIGAKNPAKFASQMLVASIVSKDLVGCFLYTTQSWYNKKIPEKKRKFVAMVDLMNGIVMVGGQFLIGKIIDNKVTPKIIAKKLTGIFDKNGIKEITNNKALFASDNLLNLTKKIMKDKAEELTRLGVDINSKEAIDHFSKKVIKSIGEGSKSIEAYKTGANILIAALATTALTKRTLAPLISTPMATWANKKFFEKDNKKNQKQEPVHVDTYNAVGEKSSSPAAFGKFVK